jgi:hypothetical protein
MRTFQRAVLINTLCLATAAAASLAACSTTPELPPDTPDASDDGGGGGGQETGSSSGALPDGAVTDAAVVQPPTACTKNEDCSSGVCNLVTKLCLAPDCKDGVKNALETDIDCGGSCAKCDHLKKCKLAADCVSGVCKDVGGTGLICQAPTSTDSVKNGNETGVDCGGTGNPTCPNGQACNDRADCTSGYCKALVCTEVKDDDLVQNGDETDVDCGGPGAKRCADGLKCLVDTDCASDVCTGLICQVPSPTDGKKNGSETDVDCGGDPAHPCAVGQSCLVGTDCSSLGCDYNKKCALGRSCTAHYGGDTCGYGGDGSLGVAAWESCCATATVTPTAGNPGGIAPVKTGKYQVTAGRIRVFLESINYNVRSFVQNKRDVEGTMPRIPGDPTHYVLEPDWDLYLPTSFAGNNAPPPTEIAERDQGSAAVQQGIYTSIKNHLGGLIFFNNQQAATGCFVGSSGGGTHAFRFPDDAQDGPMPTQSQDVYDTKSMQCIDYLVAQAFCVWDGGRLETTQEWLGAWGPDAMPWKAVTTQTPTTPGQRQKLDNDGNPVACPGGVADCGNVAGQPATWSCNGAQQCVLAGGEHTYWGCRFPWATDASHNACGLVWPATTSIEYADFQYSYEYPKLVDNDYIVFISAPGRTKGRGPAGHADVIGTNYGITSNITFGLANRPNPGDSIATPYDNTPHTVSHDWNGSGSWEVHGYTKGRSRRSSLVNKYGKLGLRCAYP